MGKCDIHQATHVQGQSGPVERIASKWGIDAAGRLAKPSEGGFGCVTESGRRISMMEATVYWMLEEEDLEQERIAIVHDAVQAADRILMKRSDGSAEELTYLTIDLARRFAEKAAMSALSEILKKQFLTKIHPQREGG